MSLVEWCISWRVGPNRYQSIVWARDWLEALTTAQGIDTIREADSVRIEEIVRGL